MQQAAGQARESRGRSPAWREETARAAGAVQAELQAVAAGLAQAGRTRERVVGRLEEMIRLLGAWDTLSLEERKQLLRHAVSRCVVYHQAVGRGRAGVQV